MNVELRLIKCSIRNTVRIALIKSVAVVKSGRRLRQQWGCRLLLLVLNARASAGARVVDNVCAVVKGAWLGVLEVWFIPREGLRGGHMY